MSIEYELWHGIPNINTQWADSTEYQYSNRTYYLSGRKCRQEIALILVYSGERSTLLADVHLFQRP